MRGKGTPVPWSVDDLKVGFLRRWPYLAAMEDSVDLAGLARDSGQVIRDVAGYIAGTIGSVQEPGIEVKALNSLVSHVDRESERRLVEGLRRLLPGAGFLTEEETVRQENAEFRWIIDPLDGTTNYLHGIPFFAVSVALEHHGRLVLGIVHEVVRGDHFCAWNDGGAWLNDAPIRVAGRPDLSGSLMATGFPYTVFDRESAYLQTLQTFMHRTRGLRRIGSASLDLAYVACGRFDAYFESRLQPWDVAAGIVLVREAGGLATDFHGHDHGCEDGSEILAASAAVHGQALEVIREHFNIPAVD